MSLFAKTGAGVFVCSSALFLLGCFSSSSSDSGNEARADVSPNGIWRGDFFEDGIGPFDVDAIIYEGRIYAISVVGQAIYAGTYSMDGDQLRGSATNFIIGGPPFAFSDLSATVQPRNRVNSTAENTFFDGSTSTSIIDLSYDDLYERPVSLSVLSGNYQATNLNLVISIDGNGGVFGQDGDGCVINGSVDVPEESRNIYTVDLTIESCSVAGNYQGLGYQADALTAGDNNSLQLVFNSSEFIFFIPMIRQ